jgi:hypothetical protein
LLCAEWYEAPDKVQPYEYLSAVASEDEIRRAYRRFGARFQVDANGTLTLRWKLSLGEEPLYSESLRL